MQLFRALIFYAGLSLATIVFLPVTLLLYPFPLPLRFRVISRWAVFNLWTLRHICGIDFRVIGKEHIPAGAGIIMCKHQSAWETLALQLIFPPQVWVLKRELLFIPIYGWALAGMQPIAIDRSSTLKAMRGIVRQGAERLRQGLWVVVFPEGTRVVPGTSGKYLPGGGMLAEKTGYPIVPVAHNAGYFWPKNSIRKWPGTITMVIGPIIDSTGRSATELTRLAEVWIEGTVKSLPVPDHWSKQVLEK